MTKKFTFLLMALLALTGFRSWGQETLTVCDGTVPSYQIPINGYWFDTQNTVSQFVIPSSKIAELENKSITQLQFYIFHMDSYGTIENAVVECSLAEVESEVMTGGVTSGLTKVFEGNLSTASSSVPTTMSVPFDTPYNYGGGNLLVSIKVITSSGAVSYGFYGESVNYNASYCHDYQDNFYWFLPKTTITYEQGVSCPAPTGLAASGITATGATISWTGNGAESYDLAYGLASTFDLSNPSTYTLRNGLTTTSVQLTGLTAETEYKCAVKAHCSDEDESAWSAVCSFTPTAKTTLTVNDGTETNARVPFWGYNADYHLTQSQFIIPANQIENLAGGEITDLTFYVSAPDNKEFTYNTWKVYVKEVDETSVGYAYIDFSSMTEVYSGGLNIVDYKLVVHFNTPYVYNSSKNLMIGFDATYNYTWASTSWLGKDEGSEMRSRGGYGTDHASYTFLPKTTFTYLPGASQEYTVNLHVNGVVTEETITSLPTPETPAGMTFCGWTSTDIETYTTEAPTYVTPLSDEIIDLYAVFSYSEAEQTRGQNWVKITNPSELVDGEEIVLVYNDSYVMGGRSEYETNYVKYEAEISDGKIANLPTGATIFTLSGTSGSWKLNYYDIGLSTSTTLSYMEYYGDGYLGYYGIWQSWGGTSYDEWSAEGTSRVIFKNNHSYEYIGEDENVYAELIHSVANANLACEAYKKDVATATYYMTEVLTGGEVANLATKNIIVINPITVSGRLEMHINGLFRNENTANFVFEDGAQFYYPGTETVNATFEKEIEGYSSVTDKYYFIANPTDNDEVANLTENDYDLYYFDSYGDEEGFEWMNMAGEEEITVKHYEDGDGYMSGYLYANRPGVTLQFAGNLLPAGDAEFILARAEDGEGIDFPGFNLVGNPYACNVYVGKPAYLLDGNGYEPIQANAAIAPCEGFFVEAAEDGETMTLSTTEPEEPERALNITVSKNRGNVIDRAIVSFNGTGDLHKFMMNPNHTNIRLAKNGEEFAVLSADAEGEIPVSFKAEKNGTYTISVNTDNVEAQYLHLIDNMTGMDTDLLSTSSYTFNASTSDYAYRFKLVFSVNGVEEGQNDADNFAFMSDGNLVIDNIEGEATLQIVDVLGRVLSTETVSGSYNKALNLKAGLYVLNLNGMTQKIVVR